MMRLNKKNIIVLLISVSILLSMSSCNYKEKMAASFFGKRSELKSYAASVIPVSFDDTVNGVARSRILKTTIPDGSQSL